MSSGWSLLLNRSSWFLSLLVLFTCLFAWHLQYLQFDSSPSTLILSGSPEKEYHEKITRVFGSDQILLIALSTGDVLQPRTLRDIRDLTGQLERIPGIRRVLSLTNASDLKGEKDEVAISPLVPEDLQSLNREALQARIQANPLFIGNLVSKDLQTACLIAFMEEFDPRSALAQGREVTRQVRSKVRSMEANYHAIIGACRKWSWRERRT